MPQCQRCCAFVTDSDSFCRQCEASPSTGQQISAAKLVTGGPKPRLSTGKIIGYSFLGLMLFSAILRTVHPDAPGSSANENTKQTQASSAGTADTSRAEPSADDLTPEQKKHLRAILAQSLDTRLLEAGLDAEISDIEGKHPYLRVKYSLMTRALAYQTMNHAWTAIEWSKTGFDRVVFTDGYENSWVYDQKMLKQLDRNRNQ